MCLQGGQLQFEFELGLGLRFESFSLVEGEGKIDCVFKFVFSGRLDEGVSNGGVFLVLPELDV